MAAQVEVELTRVANVSVNHGSCIYTRKCIRHTILHRHTHTDTQTHTKFRKKDNYKILCNTQSQASH